MTTPPQRVSTGRDHRTTIHMHTTEEPRKPLNQMTPDEIRAWIRTTRYTLTQKKARERAYLDRRARRGIHTPIDDVYEQDQRLLADLLAMLDEMEITL